MIKKKGSSVVVVLFVAVFAVIGLMSCDAFKDYYEGAENPLIPVEEDSASGDVSADNAVVPDFEADTTACEATKTISVSIDKNQGIIANMGWTLEIPEGDTVVVEAEKLGEFTTRVVISKKALEGDAVDASLALTIKQVGVTKFNVCEVALSDASGEFNAADVSLGSVVLDKFNEPGEEGKILNSAFFNLTFVEGSAAITGAFFTDTAK